jgi:hypothetical protein
MIIPHFGKKPLDTIRSCDVEDFMATILGECSPAYVNNCAHDEGAYESCREAVAHRDLNP